jgi:hypothetical protein
MVQENNDQTGCELMLIRSNALTLFLLLPGGVYAADGGGTASFEDSGFDDATSFRVAEDNGSNPSFGLGLDVA